MNWNINSENTVDERLDLMKRLTVCIGVQKSGTTSLKYIIQETISHLWALKTGLHYFDWKLWKQRNDLNSFEIAMNRFIQYNMSINEYINIMLTRFHEEINNETTRNYYFFHKTPSNILYPHIAYIFANDIIKYGTKLIILLRNPLTRFISSYFHQQKIRKNKKYPYSKYFNQKISEYLTNTVYNNTLNGHNSFMQFNRDLNNSYIEYIHNNTYNITQIVDRYNEFIYYFHRNYNYHHRPNAKIGFHLYFFIWIRSCYAPQILTWIHYIFKLNKDIKFKHSIKIIQSEQLFNPNTYQLTMKHIICYIHYNIHDNNFKEWIKECVVNNDYMNGLKYQRTKKNSQTPISFKPNKQENKLISKSFKVCNDLLKLLITDNYHYIVLANFNWTFWQ